MTKTISELWSGNLDPISRLGMNNIEIAKMEKLMLDNYKNLKAKLNDEQKEILAIIAIFLFDGCFEFVDE